ncbi:hypothetical protein EGR_05424 [Echinococcus granulosus]|uniref:Uncharacterized protein n=1 Tax=Echinococcus granulosus TaxID=6210 RepID=W6UN88_ECHGR|nr:hypothetical protein EGR_05424 [Echinococcus granulosus]EUB59662.1 hypothetical protein EGR_05424 [Echinococcus granulosus]
MSIGQAVNQADYRILSGRGSSSTTLPHRLLCMHVQVYLAMIVPHVIFSSSWTTLTIKYSLSPHQIGECGDLNVSINAFTSCIGLPPTTMLALAFEVEETGRPCQVGYTNLE